MKHHALIIVFWAIVASFSLEKAQACTLVCNDQVQVSLSPEGFAVVTPDMILEGDSTDCPGPKIVQITFPTGIIIGDTVTCEHVGMLLPVKIIDVATGNYCWGSIFVEDKLPPVITCQNLTVNCTDDVSPDSLGFPPVTDNCQVFTLTFTDQNTLLPCTNPLSALLTRTWFAQDGSGNNAMPCVQTISVLRPDLAEVVFPPNLDGVEAPPISCPDINADPSNTGFPTIGGNPVTALCKIIVTYEDLEFDECEGVSSIIRTWTVLDCCTNEILTHDQLIHMVDEEGPVFECPDSLTFGANGPGCAGTFFLPALPVIDSCSSTVSVRTITPIGMINGNGGLVVGLPLGSYTVIYEGTDDCGNVTACEVPLTVADNTAPVAVCDENTVVTLNTEGLGPVFAESFDDGSYDACFAVTFLVKRMDEPAAPFAPTVLFDCDDVGDTVMVILQVKDCFGNTNTCMVQVTVQEKTPPQIVCPPDITITCDVELPPPTSLTGEPVATDNCALDTLFFTDVNNLTMCQVGTILRTFTVFDSAGFSASCTQIITLVDTTGFSFFFPADTTVNCDVPLDGPIGTQPMAFADCEIFGLNFTDQIFPLYCGLKILRTYTFLEWCSGFDTSYTQVIFVEDHAPPVWDQAPGELDMMFNCPGDLVKPPPPTATDFCTPVEVFLVSDMTMPGDCPDDYVRMLTFGAMDTCGNVAENFVITLTVMDTIAPYADTLPTIGPFTCYEDIPPPNIEDVTGEEDRCLGPVTVEFVSDSPDPGTCEATITRKYKLTDVCGNDTLICQLILVNDTLPPTANAFPFEGAFSCFEEIPLADTSFVTGEIDQCGGAVTVAFASQSGGPGCDTTVVYTYSLTDQCNNQGFISQTFIIQDTIPPALLCQDSVVANIFSLTCERVVSVSVSTLENCLGTPTTVTNNFNGLEGTTLTDTFQIGTTEVVFTAEDDCGNQSTCSVQVIVREHISPNVFCAPFMEQFSALNPPPIFLDVEKLEEAGVIAGEDFCTEVDFTIFPATIDCSNYTCGMEPDTVHYTLTVTDAFGNSAQCTNTITVFACEEGVNICGCAEPCPPALVAGLVFNEKHVPMPDVEVQLEDDFNMSTVMTSDLGMFMFENVPAGASCTLKPFKNNGLLNGVTTYDIVLITRHILGTQPLGSPYKMIAADVDKSGAITTFDQVLLRKVILQISNEFPGNTSWRFIPADYEFPNPANPFSEPLPESVWLENMTSSEIGRHFVALKVGDVNGSAVMNFSGGEAEDRSAESITLAAPDWILKKGETVNIPVRLEEAHRLSALQMTLEYDTRKLALKGVSGAGMHLEPGNFAEPQPGFLTFSWDDSEGQDFGESHTLFFLQFQVFETASIREALTMNSALTQAIAYTDNGNPLNVAWRIHAAQPPVPVDASLHFTMMQNRPNPFSQGTQIEFLLNERMPVKLEIFDLSGKKRRVLEETLEEGWHKVPLGRDVFTSGKGVYFYQLITPFGAERKKMLFIGD